MALRPGTQLGPYEILSALGAGGMGEVYKAHDNRLNRSVAIKVLPAAFATDPDRLARFEREAKAVAALSHPNILAIFDTGVQDTHAYVVTELLDGETLGERLQSGPLPVRKAIEIAVQIARGLAAAHAKGIVHRDLKPANVFVLTDGQVKILDFGLAKAITTSSDTTAAAVTDPGSVLGTAGYMAPEQVRGQTVDARTDLFAFGAVLYEMLSGHRAFKRDTAAETLTAILNDEPPELAGIRPDLSSALERIVRHCLEKNPAERFQTARDVAFALEAFSGPGTSGATSPTLAPVATRKRRRWLTLTIAGSSVALLVGVGYWRLREPPLVSADAPMRVVPLTSLPGDEFAATFSPDCREVAFEHGREAGGRTASSPDDNWGIYVMTLDSREPRRLSPDHRADHIADWNPSWSPDGQHIAFIRLDLQEQATARIYVMSPFGTGVLKVSDLPSINTMAWSPDSAYIVAGRTTTSATDVNDAGIYLVPVHGGGLRRLTRPGPRATDFAPAFSPDGTRLAYVSCEPRTDCAVNVLSLTSSFDPSSPPRRIASMHTSIGAVAWSRSGETLVFDTGTAQSYLWRVAADGSSPAERLELAGISANAPVTCRTQNRLIFSRGQYDEDVFEFEPGRPPSPVLVSRFADYDLDIAPDGRLVFASTRSGEQSEIWLANADGSDPHQLAHGPGIQQGSPHWSPDGTRIVFDSLGDDGRWHIWLIDALGGPLTQLTQGQGSQTKPTWSADGRAIYYSAAQPNSDHWDICRLTLSNGQVTRITQTQPSTSFKAYEWGPAPSIVYKQGDGNGPLLLQPTAGGPGTQLNLCVLREAFYVRPVGIFYVSCGEEGDAILRLNDPRTGQDRILGRLDGYWEFGYSTIAVSPDGGRVLYERGVQQVPRHLMMIENFR